MTLKFIALPTNAVQALQRGDLDANDQLPERYIAKGENNPCRHCLSEIWEGDAMLILGYRPFKTIQPYAEVGPIFLCANTCERYPEASATPPMLLGWEKVLLKGYDQHERVIYGTGTLVSGKEIASTCVRLFENQTIAYIHIRSAFNNCYHCRVERAT